MPDRGVLDIGEGGDLSRLRIADDGYSSIRRGSVTLYPVKREDGALYFSRKPSGDGSTRNTNPLVDLTGN